MSKIIEITKLGIKFPRRTHAARTLRDTMHKTLRKKSMHAAIYHKKYFWALRDISITINDGEILGVIGGNGSGKTTLLRAIAGIYPPDEGTIEVHGTLSTLLSLGAGFNLELSGLENIYLNGILMGFKEAEISRVIADIIDFSELAEFISSPVKTYSSGMRARLGFSIAVHLKKDIMLIDEILGVGDAQFRNKSEQKLRDLMRENRTIILVSHSLRSIQKYATRVVWLERGSLRASGPPDEVISKYLNK